MKVCDKTCIFFFFHIINKYFLMAKRSLLSRCPSYLCHICTGKGHLYLKEISRIFRFRHNFTDVKNLKIPQLEEIWKPDILFYELTSTKDSEVFKKTFLCIAKREGDKPPTIFLVS